MPATGPMTAPAIQALFDDGVGLGVVVGEEFGNAVEVWVEAGILNDEVGEGEAIRVEWRQQSSPPFLRGNDQVPDELVELVEVGNEL